MGLGWRLQRFQKCLSRNQVPWPGGPTDNSRWRPIGPGGVPETFLLGKRLRRPARAEDFYFFCGMHPR